MNGTYIVPNHTVQDCVLQRAACAAMYREAAARPSHLTAADATKSEEAAVDASEGRFWVCDSCGDSNDAEESERDADTQAMLSEGGVGGANPLRREECPLLCPEP